MLLFTARYMYTIPGKSPSKVKLFFVENIEVSIRKLLVYSQSKVRYMEGYSKTSFPSRISLSHWIQPKVPLDIKNLHETPLETQSLV